MVVTCNSPRPAALVLTRSSVAPLVERQRLHCTAPAWRIRLQHCRLAWRS